MDITQISILHHVGIVLAFLWFLSHFIVLHPWLFFVCFIYLYQVNERYTERLRRRLKFEEQKKTNQRKLLSDSETVRWLNHAVEKVWPICMEQIASQKFLMPIIPWFLDKYKPWTAKKAIIQNIYLGRNPPMFTDIRVLSQSSDDDHLVLELGMNFVSADDMSSILAVKLRKRVGFGIWAKMHITGMHIEGKIVVGVKFLRYWPFLGRLRICFVEPPYFQMTVKPMSNHGLDVTELPGIAGWLDNILAGAFEQTLVEPNMLVVDVEKFISEPTETWFSMHEKRPIAFAKVEILEAADVKPSDLNGLADPYVKGSMGQYMFQTSIHKKTLSPKWQEEFKIPICSWESPNVLLIEVHDKDHFVDDSLGNCSIKISDFRGGQRHAKWLPLQNIKTGRLHIAITVVDIDEKEQEPFNNEEILTMNEKTHYTVQTEANQQEASNHKSSLQTSKLADEFEPINIKGQERTGIWVHHPGTQGPQTWEPRKRSSTRRPDIQIQRENVNSKDIPAAAVGCNDNGDSSTSSSDEEIPEGNKVRPIGTFRKNLRKLSSVFSRGPKNESSKNKEEEVSASDVTILAVGDGGNGVKVTFSDGPNAEKEALSPDKCEGDSPRKGNVKGRARSILKHAGKSAHGLKHVLSKKESRRTKDGPGSCITESEVVSPVSESINEESPSPPKEISPLMESVRAGPASPLERNKESPTAPTAKEGNAVGRDTILSKNGNDVGMDPLPSIEEDADPLSSPKMAEGPPVDPLSSPKMAEGPPVDPLSSPKMAKGPPVRKVSFRGVVLIDDDKDGKESSPNFMPIKGEDGMDDDGEDHEESVERDASITGLYKTENEGMKDHASIDSEANPLSAAKANDKAVEGEMICNASTPN